MSMYAGLYGCSRHFYGTEASILLLGEDIRWLCLCLCLVGQQHGVTAAFTGSDLLLDQLHSTLCLQCVGGIFNDLQLVVITLQYPSIWFIGTTCFRCIPYGFVSYYLGMGEAVYI